MRKSINGWGLAVDENLLYISSTSLNNGDDISWDLEFQSEYDDELYFVRDYSAAEVASLVSASDYTSSKEYPIHSKDIVGKSIRVVYIEKTIEVFEIPNREVRVLDINQLVCVFDSDGDRYLIVKSDLQEGELIIFTGSKKVYRILQSGVKNEYASEYNALCYKARTVAD